MPFTRPSSLSMIRYQGECLKKWTVYCLIVIYLQYLYRSLFIDILNTSYRDSNGISTFHIDLNLVTKCYLQWVTTIIELEAFRNLFIRYRVKCVIQHFFSLYLSKCQYIYGRHWQMARRALRVISLVFLHDFFSKCLHYGLTEFGISWTEFPPLTR